MNSIKVKSNIRDYEVFFWQDLSFFERLADINDACLAVDRKVYGLYKKDINRYFGNKDIFYIDAVEDNKNLDYVVNLYENLTRQQAKRNLTLISIGGGITQDITGFAASTLYRGIRWVFVPTTLLAQTDSCIGSKTSLNYKDFKNLIGTFYPPVHIYICPQFLATLDKPDFYTGIGEIVKLQLMKEQYPKDINAIAEIINRSIENADCLLELINDSLNVKISYMQNDEFDLGRRNLLNYGHCFGHAVETSSGYYIPHGIAVNIGIIFANILSMNRGLVSAKLFSGVTEKLNVCNIPLELRREHFDHSLLLDSMKKDKKRIGSNLTMIIPDEQFRLHKVNDVTAAEFSDTLGYIMKILF